MVLLLKPVPVRVEELLVFRLNPMPSPPEMVFPLAERLSAALLALCANTPLADEGTPLITFEVRAAVRVAPLELSSSMPWTVGEVMLLPLMAVAVIVWSPPPPLLRPA